MNKITLEKLCEIVKVISVNNLSKDTELDYFNIDSFLYTYNPYIMFCFAFTQSFPLDLQVIVSFSASML